MTRELEWNVALVWNLGGLVMDINCLGVKMDEGGEDFLRGLAQIPSQLNSFSFAGHLTIMAGPP